MIELLRKLQNTLPRQALMTIYKAFIKPHLDYGDILYDQACKTFHKKPERMQCLSIKNRSDLWHFKRGTLLRIRLGVSRKYTVVQKTMLLFKVFKNKSLGDLYSIVPQKISTNITRNINTVPLFNTRHTFYKNYFFQNRINLHFHLPQQN